MSSPDKPKFPQLLDPFPKNRGSPLPKILHDRTPPGGCWRILRRSLGRRAGAIAEYDKAVLVLKRAAATAPGPLASNRRKPPCWAISAPRRAAGEMLEGIAGALNAAGTPSGGASIRNRCPSGSAAVGSAWRVRVRKMGTIPCGFLRMANERHSGDGIPPLQH
jgi:hypothetical protein